MKQCCHVPSGASDVRRRTISVTQASPRLRTCHEGDSIRDFAGALLRGHVHPCDPHDALRAAIEIAEGADR